MRIADIIQTAWSNLRRNKTRSSLTIIAVFIGATTLTITNGVGDGIKSYLNRQISSLSADTALITSIKSTATPTDTGPQKYDPSKVKAQGQAQQGPASSAFVMTSSDIERIRAIDGVVSVTPRRFLTVDYITTGGEKYIIDTQTTGDIKVTFDIASGKQLDNSTADYEVLLPTNYVSVLGFSSNEDALGKQVSVQVTDQLGEAKTYTATVRGVVNKSLITANTLVLSKALSLDAIAYQSTGKPEAAKNQYANAFTEFKAGLTQKEIDALKARLSAAGYEAITIKDQQKTIFSVIDAVVLVLNMFGIVALVAASFGIINTLFMAVQERTKEIGLMKAVGMSRGKIFALFSIEAALLGLIGSTLGALAAQGLGRLINSLAANSFLKDFEGLQLLSFKWQSTLVISGIIIFIAFLSGSLPARKASNLDPIEALRYE